MSAKPTVIPTWATNATFSTGDFAGLPTKVAPSAGVRQDGHIPETAPGPQHENYDRNKIGEWLTYLSDGAFSGAHAITNTLSVVALQITHTDLNTASFYAAAGTGASTVAAALVDGGLDIVPGGITNPKGLRVRAQGPIALRDTEEYRYCDSTGALTTKTRQVIVPLPQAYVRGGTWLLLGPIDGAPDSWGWRLGTGATTDILLWEPKLPQGAGVTTVEVGVLQAVNTGTDMALEVFSIAYDLGPDGTDDMHPTVASLGTHSPNPNVTDGHILTLTGLTHTVTATNGLVVKVTGSEAAGGQNDVYWLRITYTDPGPRNC